MAREELIQEFLKQNNVETKVLVFNESTRTSQDAANQAGCELSRIAKSILFKLSISNNQFSKESEEPILVIVSGSNRVSEEKLKKALMKNYSQVLKNLRIEELEIEKADADFVYEKTGFPIGGVPAFCHETKIKYVFIDQDLIKFEKVWSAAGTPHAIFEILTKDLIKLADAKITDIKQ